MYQEKYELTIGKIFAAAVRNNPEQIISYKGEERVAGLVPENVSLCPDMPKISIPRVDGVTVIGSGPRNEAGCDDP